MKKLTIDDLVKFWLFPARLVLVVTAFGWFLTSKPTTAGSLGFTVVVLSSLINILIHSILAVFGVSYWEVCSVNSGVEPIFPYLIIGSIFEFPLIFKYIDTDKCITDLEFTYNTITRKLLSLIGFFLFLVGIPMLHYIVAMWTLEPWY